MGKNELQKTISTGGLKVKQTTKQSVKRLVTKGQEKEKGGGGKLCRTKYPLKQSNVKPFPQSEQLE